MIDQPNNQSVMLQRNLEVSVGYPTILEQIITEMLTRLKLQDNPDAVRSNWIFYICKILQKDLRLHRYKI